MTDEVSSRNEIINRTSREADDREGGYRHWEDQNAKCCRSCTLELLRKSEHHDCFGRSEQEELDNEGSDQTNDDGRDTSRSVVGLLREALFNRTRHPIYLFARPSS